MPDYRARSTVGWVQEAHGTRREEEKDVQKFMLGAVRTGIHGAAPVLELEQIARLNQHGVMCCRVSPNRTLSSGSIVSTLLAIQGPLSAQLSASQGPVRM